MCNLTAHEIFVCSTEEDQKDNETNQSTHDCFTRVLSNKISYISSICICRAPPLGCLIAVTEIKQKFLLFEITKGKEELESIEYFN